MCEAEFASVMTIGRFSIIPSSLEQKWFAESPEDAAEWGLRFEKSDGIAHRRIVVIEVDAARAARMLRIPRLDNIGPGRAATLEDLAGVRVIEFRRDVP